MTIVGYRGLFGQIVSMLVLINQGIPYKFSCFLIVSLLHWLIVYTILLFVTYFSNEANILGKNERMAL